MKPFFFRVQFKDDYAASLGRAVYNFASAEWGAIWLMELLEPGYGKSYDGRTAGMMANDLSKAVDSADLPAELAIKVREIVSVFQGAVRQRNSLVHAHPHRDAGERRLGRNVDGNFIDWTISEIDRASVEFENCASAFNLAIHEFNEIIENPTAGSELDRAQQKDS